MGLNTVGLLLLFLPLVIGAFPKPVHKKSPSLSTERVEPNIYVDIGNKTRLPHNLVVNQYDIQIQPYFDAPGVTIDSSKEQTFDGIMRVKFQMLEDAEYVELDIYNLTFYSVFLYKGSTREQLISTNIDSSANRITILPVFFFLSNQTYTIELTYSGKIMDYVNGGLFQSIYTAPDGTQSSVYATHFETFPDQYSYYDPIIGSARVFPSFDDPHFKAVFNLTLIYPSSLIAIANTLDISTVSLGNGWSKTNFELTEKQSSYLLAFAIGDLVFKNGTANNGFIVRAWGWRGTENFLDFAVDQTTICVNAMTTFTGIQLPLKKLDVLAVPHFAAGGMENWGLIINAAQYVFYDPKQNTMIIKIATVDVNCHEIAHQWFGDLVTNDWWSEIMLHESFAAYFEDYLIVNGWPNQATFWDSYYISSSIESGFYSDTINSKPIIVDRGMFDGVVYSKGSALLRMLSSVITPSIYQEGLQNYLNKYKLSTANHEMLFAAITETVSKYPVIVDWCGRPLNVTTFLDPWFEQPHFPVLTVSYDSPTNSYYVKQQPFVYFYNYSWAVPFYAKQIGGSALKLYWSGPSCDGSQASPSVVQIPSNSDGPLLVNLDTNTFARVQYDDYTFQQILNALDVEANSFTDNILIRLMLDEIAIVARNRKIGQPSSYLRTLKILAAALKNNGTNSGGVFVAVQSYIDDLVSLSLDSYERDLFNLYLNNILTPLYMRTGWKQNGTEDWNLSTLQEVMLPYAVRFNLGDSRSQAMVQFNNLVSKCNETSDFIGCNNILISIRSAVYCGAALSGDSNIFNMLFQFLKSAKNYYSFRSSEVFALTSGMACTQDPGSINKFLNYAFLTDFMSPNDLLQLQINPLASDILYNYILNNYVSVSYRSDGLYYALQAMTSNWITDNRINQLNALRKALDHQLTPNDRKVFAQTILMVESRSPIAKSDRAEVVRHLYDQYVPIGEIPWTQRLPQGVVVAQNYQLSVLPYIPNKSFVYLSEKNFTYDANITITLKTLVNLQSISLNSHRQVISSISASIMGSSQVIPISSVSRDFNNAIITLMFGSTIPAGSVVQLIFNYSGFIFDRTPNEGMISNYEYLKADGRKHWIFATDFEGGPSTRSLAVCLDEPSYKAVWQVTIIYPGEFTALSNTLEQSFTNLGNGLVQTVFKPTNLMSSYLLALTIGHYSCVQGVSTVDRALVRIWTWTGMEQYGQKALEFAIATVDYLSSTLNQPMPLEKFDVLALPQYSGSAYGAMENWGLVIAGYREVLFHPDYCFTEELVDIQNTVSHELTHHWFGDLVTLNWWTNLFLNEGFATYWPPRVMNATLPAQSAVANLYVFDIHERALQLDDYAATANPVTPDNTLIGTNGYRIFSQSVYRKAASIITTLKNVFGDDSIFNQALHNYVQSHALGNADDLSLWKSMDAIARTYKIKGWTGSTLSATTMMLPYTRQFSAPQIHVLAAPNGYSLGQSSLVASSQLPNSSYNYQWVVPFRTLTPGSNPSKVNWLSMPSGSLPTSNGALILNPEGQTHTRVLYDDAVWAPIYTTLKQNPGSIDEVTRAQLLTDAWAFVKTKKISWERFLNHTTYLSNEYGFIPWQFALRGDGFISTFLYNFRFHKIYSNLKVYLKGITGNLKMGNFVSGSDWSQNMLNSSLLEFRCFIGDTSCLGSSLSFFNKFITQCQYAADGTGKCNPTSPEFRSTQFCYGLKQNQGGFSVLRNLADWWRNNPASNSYFPQDSQSILRGLSCSGDTASINNLITATLNNQLSSYFLYNLGDNDIHGTALYNYLSANITFVVDSDLFPQYIDAMTTSWSTDDQLNAIKSITWPSSMNDYKKQVVDSAIQKINNLRSWLSTDGVTVQNWINNYVSSP